MFCYLKELDLLFQELDEDNDGKVSFKEFLNGLFAAKDHYQDSIIEEEVMDVQQSTPYSKPSVNGFASSGRLKVWSWGFQLLPWLNITNDLVFLSFFLSSFIF